MLLSTAVVAVGHAETLCVNSASSLESALQSTAASSADDEIRIVTGSYTLGAVTRTIRGDLTISGGWLSGCAGRIAASRSTLIGPTASNFNLTMGIGNLLIERLVFSDWSQVIIVDLDNGNAIAGDVRISRCRFTGSAVIGLFASAGHHDLVVENSLFDHHQGTALRINRDDGDASTATALLNFVTVAQPAVASATGIRIDTNDALLGQLRIYNSVSHGHAVDLRLRGQPALIRNSLWNTAAFFNNGAIDPASSNNRSGDPGLAADFAPIEPGSQLINNAQAFAGLTPSSDYDGGARQVGSRPDIGAIESTVNDVSTLIVSSTADSGAGTLRNALISAESNPAFKRIAFNIAGACPRFINLDSPLPVLTRPVEIDGYSQPGASTNAAARGFDGTVCAVLTGGNTVATGLRFAGASAEESMSVRGLGFYGFNSAAIEVSGASPVTIAGNLFGTGAGLIGQFFAGSVIRITDAPGSVVGGPNPEDRNIIGGGQQFGIQLEAAAAGRTITNNAIGSNLAGTSALANEIGVRTLGASGDRISNNLISFNRSHGILVGSGAAAVVISANRIGAANSPSASTVGGNGANGVRIESGQGHSVVLNQVLNNATDGIVVLTAARRVLILNNILRNNTLQAIDLSPDGVNPIDLDVNQTGANDQQNFPQLLSALGSAQSGSVRGVLASANGSYRIELFVGTTCLNANGFTSAATRLAQSSTPLILDCATPTANCVGEFTIPVSNQFIGDTPLIGSAVTAVAIDEENNSSEVSACQVYANDVIFASGAD